MPREDGLVIRHVTADDVPAICDIYNHYIEHTTVSFEENTITSRDMQARVDKVVAAGFPWLVAVRQGLVIGYTYAYHWKERSAYRYSAEVTVYLASDAVGKGNGTKLYGKLFELLQSMGIQTVLGGIVLPNPASVALHEKMGLVRAAVFKRVGFKFDEWLNVGYWQGNPGNRSFSGVTADECHDD